MSKAAAIPMALCSLGSRPSSTQANDSSEDGDLAALVLMRINFHCLREVSPTQKKKYLNSLNAHTEKRKTEGKLEKIISQCFFYTRFPAS